MSEIDSIDIKNPQTTDSGSMEGGTPKASSPKKKRGPLARLLRWIGIILLTPIILFFVLAALLYVPFIQDWAVGIACEKMSESTGMDVKVERVRLSFPLDVDLQKLCIIQPDTLHPNSTARPDTVLAVEHCVVDLDLCGLLGLKLGVDAFDLEDVVVDSHDMVASMLLKGRLQNFHLDAHDLELKQNHVNITAAELSGCDLDIALRDTTIIDTTTSEPTMWMLDFANIKMHDTRVAFHTALDTMSVRAGIQDFTLDKGSFDLGHGKLLLESLELAADSVLYDQNYQPRTNGLDFNHLALYDLTTSLPSLDYDLSAGHLQTTLSSLAVREKSGLELEQLTADVELDDSRVKVKNAKLKTPSSELRAFADIEWDALSPNDRGRFDATLSADFSKQDVLLFASEYLPANVKALYPDRMLTAEVELAGNIDNVDVKSFRVMMPGMVDATVSGSAGNLVSDGGLSADLHWFIKAQDLSLVKKIAGITDINLPPMTVFGDTHIAGNLYRADLNVLQGKGTLHVNGQYNTGTDFYKADIDAKRFTVSNFVPMEKALTLTAKARAEGNGFDILSNKTRLRALVNMPSATYGSSNIGKMRLDAKLAHGDGFINFFSDSELVDADGCVELTVKNHAVDSAAFAFDLRGLDLYALGITEKPFKASMAMHMLGNSNLSDEHYVKGDMSAIQLTLKDTTFYPRDINLEAYLNPDTTFAFLSAGDLLFRLNSTEGLSDLMNKATVFADSLTTQMTNRHYQQQQLIRLLPKADLCVQSGRENPLANVLATTLGYTYREFDIDLSTSPLTGIKGNGHIYSTNTGSIVLDTIAFDLKQDSVDMNLNARVCNGKKNKDVTFDALMQANFNPGKAGVALQFFDAKNKKGVDLGAEVGFADGGMRLHLYPLRPILAYRYFTLNEDNYIEMQKNGHIDANLDLVADDGTGIKLFSTPNEEADQDLTASLNHFNLGELCNVLPYMPHVTGMLHGDVHYTQQGTISSFMADLTAEKLHYEGCDMGNVGINAAYMPNEDGTHFVDGYLTQNETEVLSFTGSYADKGTTDEIDAEATLEKFPIALINGFMGETVNLSGNLLGTVNVTGSTSKPQVDGALVTDSLHILSPLYSVNMRIQDDSIRVSRSRLNLDKLQGYTTGATPLTLDGIIDFYNLDNIKLDVTAKAKNFELINAQKNRKAAAYGKVYVDLDMRAKGTTNNLSVTGKLGVLGNTNVTYVLLDSPITVEDEMADLVTFCDFSDTLEVEEPQIVPPSNLNMRFLISIDQGANVNCLLSEDGANYIKLEGGGDLTMTYDDVRGMQLFGRYTILEGQMTYTLMVMSLKDCKLENGSYVEFTGDISNPHLSVSAHERINSSITENETPRTVAFDVGLRISQTLNNMGLEFTLDAPEDMSVQNEIAQMTPEQRSRVAVTLMATGMYLVEGQQTGGFNTTNALNSFLQSQISSITGKALNSIDLSLGVQNNATASGSHTTDYSFRFAKRFWGNRISLIVGGKVSSGSEAVNTGQSIIDNVSIEYRLDKSATRYVTVYYDNNNESVLEGKVTEMGAGLVLRKKTDRLGELFLFRTKKKDDELNIKEEMPNE